MPCWILSRSEQLLDLQKHPRFGYVARHPAHCELTAGTPAALLDAVTVFGVHWSMDGVASFEELVYLGQLVSENKAVLRTQAIKLSIVDVERFDESE